MADVSVTGSQIAAAVTQTFVTLSISSVGRHHIVLMFTFESAALLKLRMRDDLS